MPLFVEVILNRPPPLWNVTRQYGPWDRRAADVRSRSVTGTDGSRKLSGQTMSTSLQTSKKNMRRKNE